MVEPEKNTAASAADGRPKDPSEETLLDRYPGLRKLVLIDWEWGEPEDLWLEHMTGEPQGKRRGARNPDL